MNTSSNVQIMHMPSQGPLSIELTLYYKDGSYDHTREGKKLHSLVQANGSEIMAYELEDSKLPGITLRKEQKRSGRTQWSKFLLEISTEAILPITLKVTEINEYYPDYFNQLDLPDDERSPQVENRDVEIRVERTL